MSNFITLMNKMFAPILLKHIFTLHPPLDIYYNDDTHVIHVWYFRCITYVIHTPGVVHV